MEIRAVKFSAKITAINAVAFIVTLFLIQHEYHVNTVLNVPHAELVNMLSRLFLVFVFGLLMLIPASEIENPCRKRQAKILFVAGIIIAVEIIVIIANSQAKAELAEFVRYWTIEIWR